jgi:uncharacterized protein (TIGR02246 family)
VKDLLDRRRAWSDAVNARDIDAYADIVAEDVVWIPPSGDAIVGRAAFRRWLEPFFGAFEYDYGASNPRYVDAGDWIVERSDFESRITPVAGGSTMSHPGSYLVIWRRDADGLWRIDRYVDDGPLQEATPTT